eukprot:8310676-Lingulodinium_polyedra.AAC.1
MDPAFNRQRAQRREARAQTREGRASLRPPRPRRTQLPRRAENETLLQSPAGLRQSESES